MIVGLHGRLESGKDTVYSIMDELHYGPVVRRAFADPLKVSAARALGAPIDWPAEKCVQFCNRLKRSDIVVYECDDNDEWIPFPLLASLNGREFLQYYGTEAHREVFGTNFWVDAALPPFDGLGNTESNLFGTDDGGYTVFTDVRFPNEAQRVREYGGEIWEVVRFDDEADGHASEQRLPDYMIDAVIDNRGSIADLYEIVRAMLAVQQTRSERVHLERIS